MPAAPTRVSRLPFLLLALMTIATFGGPVAFGLVLRGGARPDWPPDRSVEWWALGIASGIVAALMLACFALGWANLRAMHRPPTAPGASGR